MKKVLSFLFVFAIAQTSFAKECAKLFQEKRTKVIVNSSLLNNQSMPFVSRSNALAMNIEYGPIVKLRADIKKALNLKADLNFLTAWEPAGEAHITVITPPEATKLFAESEKYISKMRIDEIANENKIQQSDLKFLGIGSGKKQIDDCLEQTFYIIVASKNLLDIRRQIYKEFMLNGGSKDNFDPYGFYPHITIGYTARDLHESDGVIKDIKSLDSRFELFIK